jgi:hypothetical protein
MAHSKETMSVQKKVLEAIRFLTAENVPSIDTHRRMKVVRGDG